MRSVPPKGLPPDRMYAFVSQTALLTSLTVLSVLLSEAFPAFRHTGDRLVMVLNGFATPSAAYPVHEQQDFEREGRSEGD